MKDRLEFILKEEQSIRCKAWRDPVIYCKMMGEDYCPLNCAYALREKDYNRTERRKN